MVVSGVNLNRLGVFVAVVEAGSMAGAARRLGLARAVVTTHVQRLEREVGASLVVRTTRHLTLTEAGESFYQASRSILLQAEDAIAAASRDDAKPRGTLRITLPIDYSGVIAPVAAELTRRHPQLKVELVTVDRVVDLVRGQIDLAIRLGTLKDSSHRALRVGSFERWLVASPVVARQLGTITNPEDLDGTPFVALSVLDQPASWSFSGPRGRKVRVNFRTVIACDSVVATRRAALADAGCAVLTDFGAGDDVAAGRLVRILPEWALPVGGIHVVSPAKARQPRKVQAFLAAFRQSLATKARRQRHGAAKST